MGRGDPRRQRARHNLIVQLKLNMRTILHEADADALETVPTTVLEDAVRRWPGSKRAEAALAERCDEK